MGVTISSQMTTAAQRREGSCPGRPARRGRAGLEPGLPPRGATEWTKPGQEQAWAPDLCAGTRPSVGSSPRDRPPTGPRAPLPAPSHLMSPLPPTPSPSIPIARTLQRGPSLVLARGLCTPSQRPHRRRNPSGLPAHSAAWRPPPLPCPSLPTCLFHCPQPLSLPQEAKGIPSQILCRGLRGPRPAATPSLGVSRV